VATHGFFFPDPQGEQASNEKTFKVSENPMIRSGLVLAGGNHSWKTGKPLRPGLEDGILTAYEISQMNLSNTELAVLSACETGLGDLVGNEGVYGLQRAFKIAGAKYLIMSLWQVPDRPTQVFMTTFYKHWLTDGMEVPEAFRTTQSEMQTKYGEAFKWAGFVLVE
jgi:CHAT domain-containing protein